jgi:hypothetical protein
VETRAALKATAHSLALLWLALVLAGCASHAGEGRIPGPSCDSLDNVYLSTIGATRNRQLEGSFLRVPVVIHLMTDRVDPADKWPEKYWTADLVATYFGVGNLSVNAVWAPAKIHFDLKRVQRCFYAPPPGTFKLAVSGAKGMFPPDVTTLRERPPAEQQVIIDHYLRLNADYGVSRMLNVYLWRNIFSGVNGYGESPRRNRIEVTERRLEALATLWYESWLACGAMPEGGDDCQLSVAHEVGHALGLAHSCYLCGAQPGAGTCCTDLCWAPRDYYYTCPAGDTTSHRWDNWCACEGQPGEDAVRDLTACGERFQCCDPNDERHRLMYPKAGKPKASGFKLCEGEIQSARSGVREFFYNNVGGATWPSIGTRP